MDAVPLFAELTARHDLSPAHVRVYGVIALMVSRGERCGVAEIAQRAGLQVGDTMNTRKLIRRLEDVRLLRRCYRRARGETCAYELLGPRLT